MASPPVHPLDCLFGKLVSVAETDCSSEAEGDALERGQAPAEVTAAQPAEVEAPTRWSRYRRKPSARHSGRGRTQVRGNVGHWRPWQARRKGHEAGRGVAMARETLLNRKRPRGTHAPSEVGTGLFRLALTLAACQVGLGQEGGPDCPHTLLLPRERRLKHWTMVDKAGEPAGRSPGWILHGVGGVGACRPQGSLVGREAYEAAAAGPHANAWAWLAGPGLLPQDEQQDMGGDPCALCPGPGSAGLAVYNIPEGSWVSLAVPAWLFLWKRYVSVSGPINKG